MAPTQEEAKYFKATVLVCYWDMEESRNPDARTNYYRLRRTLTDQYGYFTHLHRLEHARSSGANQLGLLTKVLHLLDGKPELDPNNGRPKQKRPVHPNKPLETGDLFVFLYMGSSRHDEETNACLLQSPPGTGSRTSETSSPPPAVVNFTTMRRAVLDVADADVLTLLDCAYDSSDAMVAPGKELIAARRGNTTNESASLSSQFTARIAGQLEKAAETKEYLTTAQIFVNLLAASPETHPVFLQTAPDGTDSRGTEEEPHHQIQFAPGRYSCYDGVDPEKFNLLWERIKDLPREEAEAILDEEGDSCRD